MSQMEKEGFGEEFSICSSFCFGGILGGHHCYSISYHCDILYPCDILWIMQNESAKLGLNLKRIRIKKSISQGDILFLILILFRFKPSFADSFCIIHSISHGYSISQ